MAVIACGGRTLGKDDVVTIEHPQLTVRLHATESMIVQGAKKQHERSGGICQPVSNSLFEGVVSHGAGRKGRERNQAAR